MCPKEGGVILGDLSEENHNVSTNGTHYDFMENDKTFKKMENEKTK